MFDISGVFYYTFLVNLVAKTTKIKNFMNIWDKICDFDIFKGLDKNDIKALTFCFKSKVQTYEKNDIIANNMDRFDNLILIVQGQASVVTYMQNGNTNLQEKLTNGSIYGDVELFSKSSSYNTTIVANKKTEVMFLNKYIVNTPCENNCYRHKIFLNNLVSHMADMLKKKQQIINILSERSTKEKVLLLLKSLEKEQNTKYILLPYSRQEMADFLAVDRSALSLTLSKMKKDKLIDFDKNKFVLL